MTSQRWLRMLSGTLGLFAAGHTIGTAAPRVTRGPDQAAVFAAMQQFHFMVNGVGRTYWDFYRGFALCISVLLAMMAMVAWSLSSLAPDAPGRALPMAIALQLACVGLLVLSGMFFFAVPLTLSAAAAVCATSAVGLLVREAKAVPAVAR